MTIIVGISPNHDDQSAVALAVQLARANTDDVTALSVVPEGWPTPVAGDTDREFERWSAEVGASSAAAAEAVLARYPDVRSTATWVAARSVPKALIDQAAELEASLIVVGSGDEGRLGLVSVTSKTDRLLHSSPVALAIAPRGHRPPAGAGVGRVSVAFRGDERTWALLDQVAAFARRIGVSVRVVTFAVRRAPMYPPPVSLAEDAVHRQWQQQAARELEAAVAHLHDLGLPEAEVTSQVAAGRSWADAMGALEWRPDEVLVLGSSSSNPLAQVFLGSSAAKLMRNAPVPVLVVPGGAPPTA